MPLYENKYVIRSIDHSGKMIVGKKSDCDIVVSNNKKAGVGRIKEISYSEYQE